MKDVESIENAFRNLYITGFSTFFLDPEINRIFSDLSNIPEIDKWIDRINRRDLKNPFLDRMDFLKAIKKHLPDDSKRKVTVDVTTMFTEWKGKKPKPEDLRELVRQIAELNNSSVEKVKQSLIRNIFPNHILADINKKNQKELREHIELLLNIMSEDELLIFSRKENPRYANLVSKLIQESEFMKSARSKTNPKAEMKAGAEESEEAKKSEAKKKTFPWESKVSKDDTVKSKTDSESVKKAPEETASVSSDSSAPKTEATEEKTSQAQFSTGETVSGAQDPRMMKIAEAIISQWRNEHFNGVELSKLQSILSPDYHWLFESFKDIEENYPNVITQIVNAHQSTRVTKLDEIFDLEVVKTQVELLREQSEQTQNQRSQEVQEVPQSPLVSAVTGMFEAVGAAIDGTVGLVGKGAKSLGDNVKSMLTSRQRKQVQDNVQNLDATKIYKWNQQRSEHHETLANGVLQEIEEQMQDTQHFDPKNFEDKVEMFNYHVEKAANAKAKTEGEESAKRFINRAEEKLKEVIENHIHQFPEHLRENIQKIVENVMTFLQQLAERLFSQGPDRDTNDGTVLRA